MAQLVEQLIRNQQVAGSSPASSSISEQGEKSPAKRIDFSPHSLIATLAFCIGCTEAIPIDSPCAVYSSAVNCRPRPYELDAHPMRSPCFVQAHGGYGCRKYLSVPF